MRKHEVLDLSSSHFICFLIVKHIVEDHLVGTRLCPLVAVYFHIVVGINHPLELSQFWVQISNLILTINVETFFSGCSRVNITFENLAAVKVKSWYTGTMVRLIVIIIIIINIIVLCINQLKLILSIHGFLQIRTKTQTWTRQDFSLLGIPLANLEDFFLFLCH